MLTKMIYLLPPRPYRFASKFWIRLARFPLQPGTTKIAQIKMNTKAETNPKRVNLYPLAFLLLNAALIIAAMAFVPLENSLGAALRLVYLHGAWVDTGKIAFGLAALAGLAALLLPSKIHAGRWQSLSLALGRTGLFFWLTYLPMSLLVMQVTWGGFFFDEPRWRVPLIFGVVGLLLQAGLYLLNSPRLASLANLVYGVALWLVLGELTNVLHPDSPIFDSGSLRIELIFVVMLALTLVLGAQIAWWLWKRPNPPIQMK